MHDIQHTTNPLNPRLGTEEKTIGESKHFRISVIFLHLMKPMLQSCCAKDLGEEMIA